MGSLLLTLQESVSARNVGNQLPTDPAQYRREMNTVIKRELYNQLNQLSYSAQCDMVACLFHASFPFLTNTSWSSVIKTLYPRAALFLVTRDVRQFPNPLRAANQCVTVSIFFSRKFHFFTEPL
jgi:hypothetical protein